MSGGGGGGGFGGIGPGTDDCGELIFTAPLNSPNPDVVRNLKEGDQLTLRLVGRRVEALTSDDRTAGSITTGNQATLIRCLEEGYEYTAHVLEVDGGHCTLDVRPTS